MTALILIIYFTGVPFGYLNLRKEKKNLSNKWSINDRREAILVSFLFSWIIIFASFIENIKDNEAPAKW